MQRNTQKVRTTISRGHVVRPSRRRRKTDVMTSRDAVPVRTQRRELLLDLYLCKDSQQLKAATPSLTMTNKQSRDFEL